MKVRGKVFSGALRGAPLIEKYRSRLVGLLKFQPYPGTMDIMLERAVDITPFSTKFIDHVLRDGSRKVNACLANVKIRMMTKEYALMLAQKREKEIKEHFEALRKSAKEKLSVQTEIKQEGYECWALQFRDGIYKNDTVELISAESIKEKLGLGDGDGVEIEFTDAKRKKWIKARNKERLLEGNG